MTNAFIYTSKIKNFKDEVSLLIVDDDKAVIFISFDSNELPHDAIINETPLIKRAFGQISEYFAGKRKSFDFPISPNGTPFMLKVWKCLQDIPFGQTKTYGQIASEAGNEKASRAVGNANNRNPISIIIPCHRVVGSNGNLTGYRGGLNIKQALLDLENL